MPTAKCPSRQELHAYFVGELDEGAARRVMEHVGACTKCQEVLQTLDDADDTLLEQLRRPALEDPYAAEPEQRKALERAKEIAGAAAKARAAPGAKPQAAAGAKVQVAAEAFDPYYRWLGIPPKEQPPHHYRLLGIRALEEDRVLIETAAEQRITHPKTSQI